MTSKFLYESFYHKCVYMSSAAVLLLSFLTISFLPVFPLQDFDTFWHLAYGRAMVDAGEYINHEVFSYTATGKPLGSHSQLAQVLMYLIYVAGGANGLILVKTLVLVVVAYFIYRSGRDMGLAVDWTSLFCLALMLACQSRFAARPQMFSYLLLAVFVYWLNRYRQTGWGRKYLWMLPILLVLWDYLHGSVYGVIFVGSLVVAETVKFFLGGRLPAGLSAQIMTHKDLRMLWGVMSVSLVLMAIHPNGLLNYEGFWVILSRGADFGMYGEWLPTTFKDFPVFWCGLALITVVLLSRMRQIDLTEVMLLVPFLYLSLRYNRAIFVFLIVVFPIFCRHFNDFLGEMKSRYSHWPGMSTVVALVLCLGLSGYTVFAQFFEDRKLFAYGYGINSQVFPVGSVQFVKDVGLRGNMYNMDGFGGYFSYFLAPERPIFHYNLPSVFEALPDFVHKPETRKQWDINYAIIGRADELNMFKRDSYVPIYWEPTGMVMIRPAVENADVVRTFGIRFFQPLLPEDKLRQMFQQKPISTQLFKEWVNYLAYRGDANKADLLGDILLKAKHGVDQKLIADRLPATLRYNPDSINLLLAYGVASSRSGNLPEALKSFESVTNLDPGNLLAKLNTGYIYVNQEDFSRAGLFFSEILEIDKENALAIYGRALTHFKTSQLSEAESLFRRYLELQPNGQFSARAKLYLSELKSKK